MNQTEAHKQLAVARNTMVVGFTIVLPGSTEAIQVGLPTPVPVEMAAMAVVNIAVQEIAKAKGEALAEKLVPTNGHFN